MLNKRIKLQSVTEKKKKKNIKSSERKNKEICTTDDIITG